MLPDDMEPCRAFPVPAEIVNQYQRGVDDQEVTR
jgi:hypothetical protein